MGKEKFIFGGKPAQAEKQYIEHIRRQRGYSYPVISERGIESVWFYDMEKETAIESAATYIAKEIRKDALPWYVRISLRRYISQKLQEIEPATFLRALKKYLRPDELKQLMDRYPLLDFHGKN